MIGRVVDGTARPVPDAFVVVTDGPVPFPEIALRTDPDGRFAVALAPGHWTVQAHGADGVGQAEVDVLAGDEETELVITIER